MWTVSNGNCKGQPAKIYQSGSERAAQAVQDLNHLLKGIPGPMLASAGHGGDPEVEVAGLVDGGAHSPSWSQSVKRSLHPNVF